MVGMASRVIRLWVAVAVVVVKLQLVVVQDFRLVAH